MARMRYIRNLVANKAAVQVPFVDNDLLEPVESDFDVKFEWNMPMPNLVDIERVKELEYLDSRESLKDETCCLTDHHEEDFSNVQILAEIIM